MWKHLFVSKLWSIVSSGARALHDLGILSSPVRLDARVVSVGNIQAGGAGKTPIVARIAQEAQERGLQVCILLRGYKSKWEKTGGILYPQSHPNLPANSPTASLIDIQLCGDEAALLHELCPYAFIGVGARRVAQYEAIKKISPLPMDLVILDDGFQNHQIKKDLEIVALTSATHRKRYFRDSARALKRADLLVWTKGSVSPLSTLFDRSVFSSTPPHPLSTKLKEKFIRIQYELKPFFSKSQFTEEMVHLKSENKFWFICGIADPETALDQIKKTGYSVEKETFFPDHIHYDQPTLASFLESAKKQNLRILLTGKDWVKWKALGTNPNEVFVLEPQLQFVAVDSDAKSDEKVSQVKRSHPLFPSSGESKLKWDHILWER